jgi:arylsulfatase A-like enzyme
MESSFTNAENSQPNIILLTLDTLRADMVSCYGHQEQLTPHIDRLAATGIRFEQAITGGSWTQAAFPVLLTSTYASMYGGCLGPLSLERPSPIRALADCGYTTAAFSTSPLLSRTYGYHRDFHFFTDLNPVEQDPILRRLKGGQWLLRHSVTHAVSGLAGIRTRPARKYVSGAELTDRACKWIDQTEAPFFCWAHYMDVHWPYHLEEKLSRPGDIAQAWRDLRHMNRVNRKGEATTPAQYQHYRQLYQAAVRQTDVHIGRLVDHLESTGRLANTIIIIVADHGEEFLERRRWGHFETNLHDEILKVPFIIYLPGRKSGCVVERQVRTLDLMPTILDLCGCPAPDGLEGESLTPLWESGRGAYTAESSISEKWRDDHHIVAIRTQSHKYIWNSRRPEQPELYDLSADPAEKDNISARFPELARKFQAEVEAHLHRVAQTAPPEQALAPEMDDHLIRRLQDLGYLT